LRNTMLPTRGGMSPWATSPRIGKPVKMWRFPDTPFLAQCSWGGGVQLGRRNY
jgi:hypothetical protein